MTVVVSQTPKTKISFNLKNALLKLKYVELHNYITHITRKKKLIILGDDYLPKRVVGQCAVGSKNILGKINAKH